MKDGSVPRWQKAVAVVWLVVLALVLALWAPRLWGDLWPLDRSPVGPNIVASYILFSAGAIATALLYPPIRRWLRRAVRRETAALHEKLDRNARLQAHIIFHHPDIPNTILEEHGLMPTRTAGRRGLKPFDPVKHMRFRSASSAGVPLPAPSYPVDQTGGLADWGMDGNGPDPTLTVNGGQPVGDCGVAAVPAHAGMVGAVLAGLDPRANAMTADQVVTLYALYEAESAGVEWRPSGPDWTIPLSLDEGVDLGDWMLWLFAHDVSGNPAEPGQGTIPGFFRLDPGQLDAALSAGFVVVAGTILTPDADERFEQHQPWDVSPENQPDPREGHAILAAGVDSSTGPYRWLTWGGVQLSTAAWTRACVQQTFGLLTRDMAGEAKYAGLLEELRGLGGTG